MLASSWTDFGILFPLLAVIGQELPYLDDSTAISYESIEDVDAKGIDVIFRFKDRVLLCCWHLHFRIRNLK